VIGPASRNSDLMQGASQVVTQFGEGAAAGCRSPDQHEVGPRDRTPHQLKPRGFLQSPPCPVTDDRSANSFRHGEANARGLVVAARQDLQYQSVGRDFASLCRHTQELGATFEADWGRGKLGHALAAGERPPILRRRAAYGPWRGGSPAPGGRRPWPCGSETRGGACGQASTADRCVSRQLSRLIEPAYTLPVAIQRA
jgi:hypothetical protein